MRKVCLNNNCIRKGVEYDDSDSICPFCEQLLSSSPETMNSPLENTQIESVILVDLNLSSIEVPLGGCVIGRSSELGDGIFNHKWISDPHCRLFILDGTLFVEDIGDSQEGSVNGTSVNGEMRIPKNTPTPLANKDRLTIAHLKFDVEIKHTHIQNLDVVEDVMVWVVVCPECTKWHKVDDSSGRIPTCDGCDDPDYAKTIAKTKAAQRREMYWKSRECS